MHPCLHQDVNALLVLELHGQQGLLHTRGPDLIQALDDRLVLLLQRVHTPVLHNVLAVVELSHNSSH